MHAYESGRLDEARALFEQVHAQAPTARTLRGLGVVAFRQRRFVDAVRLLEASLSEAEKPLTPELARGVQIVLADAGAQIGRVTLLDLDADAQVRVDGAEPVHGRDGSLLLEPGAHTLSISRPDHLERRHEIALQAGGELTLDGRLAPTPAVDRRKPAPVITPAPPLAPERGPTVVSLRTRTERRQPRLRRTGYALVGAGATALLTSLAATAAGIKRVHRIEDECRGLAGGQCTQDEAQSKSDEENLDRLAALSIGGAAVGSVCAVSGLVLWLTVARAERGPPSLSSPGGVLFQVSTSF